ncbi:GntR family transcriptional regulator, trehalose operon transcriptional repressor [Clostridium cavendishii DSM 21758]|uniref:Trehalose operon repressor n=1 Tax=Clostridium cavendishii DSM 21758 TaxID=1121302 RepID=A0A1M6LL73_9CLOT|nr:trehalose operon repressor [Clostridium cavendishii]SHJ71976.1 GntR family transcriptional regulator, trehalose operon transcriptional repressor [Clostridium cavendishii DSM 21758]
MKGVKYTDIYDYLKDKILNLDFKPGEKLPSETELTTMFNVSRNTVRRAISQLAFEGFVTSMHGKGVFVLEQKQLKFLVGGLQSFKEASLSNTITFSTKVELFETIQINEKLSKKTNFNIDSEVIHILRSRNIDGERTILDINYFSKDILKDLTKEIAENSIYEYIESSLNLKIAGAQKIISIEPASEYDKKYLDLKNYNLVAIIKNYVYLEDGLLFEYTESRHRPDKFTFSTFAKRL